jgi:hypothetical protein
MKTVLFHPYPGKIKNNTERQKWLQLVRRPSNYPNNHIGHNICNFDIPLIVNKLEECNLYTTFCATVKGFVDTMKVAKKNKKHLKLGLCIWICRQLSNHLTEHFEIWYEGTLTQGNVQQVIIGVYFELDNWKLQMVFFATFIVSTKPFRASHTSIYSAIFLGSPYYKYL